MNPTTKIPDPARAKEFFGNKLSFTTGPVEVDHMLKAHENVNVIDVRAEEDYQKGHIPGAINLSKEKWHSFEGLGKDKINVVYCYSAVCHLAAKAAYKFAEAGYPVMEMDGGFDEWKEHDLEVETGATRRGVTLNA